MGELEKYNQKAFESIKHIDKNGDEFWYARELIEVLEYKQWRRFEGVIEKAMTACENSGFIVVDHFAKVGKMVKAGVAPKEVDDYRLTRYACYLIAQNGSSSKKAIALAQTYFAIQTRKQEITEREYLGLTENERRLYVRNQTKDRNKYLFDAAKLSGVKNFGKFNNYGYQGLYNENAKQIKERKGLRKGQDILDHMGSAELGANLFRITQTEEILSKGEINTEIEACEQHNKVGKAVRKTIEELGGTMPEKLPTPKESVKQIAKQIKKLKSTKTSHLKKSGGNND